MDLSCLFITCDLATMEFFLDRAPRWNEEEPLLKGVDRGVTCHLFEPGCVASRLVEPPDKLQAGA
jgi:hypothetical protein